MRQSFQIFWALLSALASAAVCAGIYALNPRYFFIDDKISSIAPVYLDIGRMLHAGLFPWMSLGTFAASNYVLEYQYGIFNPLCLFTMWLTPMFDNQALVHALIAGIYVFFTSLSAYLFGRALRIAPPLSALLAFVVGTNPAHMVWNLAAWLPGAPGLCFLVLALAAAVFYVRKPAALSVIGVSASVYLLVLAALFLFIPAAIFLARRAKAVEA